MEDVYKAQQESFKNDFNIMSGLAQAIFKIMQDKESQTKESIKTSEETPQTNEQATSNGTHQPTLTDSTKKRVHKYETEEERHEASKNNKRQWYYRNKEQQKLKSLKAYYIKQLQNQDLKEKTKNKYESKLNSINKQLEVEDSLI